MLRAETDVDMRNGYEAADEQRRSGEQDHGQGEFSGNQSVLELASLAGSGVTARGRRESVGGAAGRAPGGNEAQRNAGENADRDGEEQNTEIDSDLIEARNASWHEGF